MTDLKTVQALVQRAFNLGETYWQQADSESRSDHRRADETLARFEALKHAELPALIAQMQREAVQPVAYRQWSSKWHDWDYQTERGNLRTDEPAEPLYAAPQPAQASDRVEQIQPVHSTRAYGVCASTTQTPETTGTRLTGSVAVVINEMQFEPPWFLECTRGACYHFEAAASRKEPA